MEIKTKSQASIVLEQAMVHLERVQHVLATLRRGAADKLQEARAFVAYLVYCQAAETF